jgi:hypothetical protein
MNLHDLAEERYLGQLSSILAAVVAVKDEVGSPTLPGISRRASELERHVEAGGTVGNGTLFFQAGRKGNINLLDWAISVEQCLPKTHRQRRLLCLACGVDFDVSVIVGGGYGGQTVERLARDVCLRLIRERLFSYGLMISEWKIG